jgi:hypothetical protein
MEAAKVQNWAVEPQGKTCLIQMTFQEPRKLVQAVTLLGNMRFESQIDVHYPD